MKDMAVLELTDVYGETNLHVAEEEFNPVQIGFALQRGSPLKVINEHFLKNIDHWQLEILLPKLVQTNIKF